MGYKLKGEEIQIDGIALPDMIASSVNNAVQAIMDVMPYMYTARFVDTSEITPEINTYEQIPLDVAAQSSDCEDYIKVEENTFNFNTTTSKNVALIVTLSGHSSSAISEASRFLFRLRRIDSAGQTAVSVYKQVKLEPTTVTAEFSLCIQYNGSINPGDTIVLEYSSTKSVSMTFSKMDAFGLMKSKTPITMLRAKF